jgi:putative DNA primase/helicase
MGGDDGDRKTALDQAIDFLREELKNGPRSVGHIEAKAQAQGIAARTIDRARKEIGVLAKKVKASWMLSLPDDQ